MVTMSAEAILDAPCPRTGLTVQGLTLGDHVITVWRAADGQRVPVRGAQTVEVVDSFYVEDFEVPLGRDVTYELEIVQGPDAGVRQVKAVIVVPSDSGYIQDPLDPASAVKVRVGPKQKGYALVSGTFAQLAYEAPVATFNIVGARTPVAISGPRATPSGIPFSVLTEAEAENTQMRELIRGSAILLIRGLPSWGSRIPGSAVYAAATVTESALQAGDDGPTIWETTGEVVRASSARITVALFTYQDVEQLFATYADKEAAVAGGTYLDDQKTPYGVGGSAE